MSTTHTQARGLGLETAGPSSSEAAGLHLVRLALDLQIDAMLLTLGAAARRPDDDEFPWRRWVVEDVDLAQMLARTILAEQVDPPAALGTGRLHAEVDRTLADLMARYASMDDLLRGVLERPFAAQSSRRATRRARARCRARLEELRRHHRAAAGGPADSGPRFLPGELLG